MARVPGWYSGILHLATNFTVSVAAIAFFVWDLAERGVRPWAWTIVPAAFLLANVLEWLVHRNPMHHRTRGLDRMFRGHTLWHHRYYTHEAMELGTRRELFFVLFPVQFSALAFITGVLLHLGLRVTFGADVASLAVVTLLVYFLLIEWLHLLTHAPARWFERGPLSVKFARYLREHHRVHHNPRLMTRHNFNITFPIADWMFRTSHRVSEPADVVVGPDEAGSGQA